jgi:cell division protein ZapE
LYMPNQQDYRLQYLRQEGCYYYPLTTEQMQKFMQHFVALTKNYQENVVLSIAGRHIPTLRLAKEVVWFDFKVLCNTPRSQIDYLEIAKSFHIIFLSNVPKIHAEQQNEITYFIYLIDILYDAQVKLVIQAAVPVDELYTQGKMLFAFQRIKSRLQEMQSIEYWHKPHLV